jgi:hypothetical protein
MEDMEDGRFGNGGHGDVLSCFLGNKRTLATRPAFTVQQPKPNQIVSMTSITEELFLHVLHVSLLPKENLHEYRDIVPRS